MADSINPYGSTSTSNFLPKFYKTDANKKFFQATVDQLIQPGKLKKVNGFIGRQNSKATVGSDIFLSAPSAQRQNYQLEPSANITDTLGNSTFFKDYQDYVNQLSVLGANVSNHSRLNKQEFYSWDPHIDWDKFINFQNYYWLPYGPEPIIVYGQTLKIDSEYTVAVESDLGTNTYLFTPNGLTRNPVLTLYRGQTYRFNITSPGNPFSIKTIRSSGSTDRYSIPGISGAGIESGVLTFTIPVNSPDILYYQSEADVDLGGVIHVLSISENTYINVEDNFLGKKTYTLNDGTPISNGMKVAFGGNVFPKTYASGEFYVEGVGTAIKLINQDVLNISTAYTITQVIPFESEPFASGPFNNTSSYASVKDYIVINRASKDQNPWSRYNRWFHRSVIETSAILNGKSIDLDQNSRAVRPIIEFESDLRLFNFGTTAAPSVDLIDTFTIDVFSVIEGARGYNIDGFDLATGQRILFAADTDKLVKNKIYRVEFVDVLHESAGSKQIHLVLDTEPTLDQTVLIKSGNVNIGQTYWFDGSTWILSQQKTQPNQPPLFDIIDSSGVSFSNIEKYSGSTFKGTTLFSYKVSTTNTTDTYLGFPLTYKNIDNFGDIVYNFNLLSDSFQYRDGVDIIIKTIDSGYLSRLDNFNSSSFVNGWQINVLTNVQAGIRIYKSSDKTNNFDIDIFDNIDDLDDLVVRVYVNGIRLDKTLWTVENSPAYKLIKLTNSINVNDVLTIKTFASQPINGNGHYEIPVNLQNNPLNGSITEFTFGEISDHTTSIIDNLENFVGVFPGISNIRDLGNITKYGTKFVQHSGPFGLALYHITSENNNVIKSIENSREDYSSFKRRLAKVANTLGIDADPVTQLDAILRIINKDIPDTAPYFFSDMVPYSGKITNTYTVLDYRIKTYPLVNMFNLDVLSNKAVLVYLNGLQPPQGIQLLYGIHYTFSDQGFIILNDSLDLNNDDTITIVEYDNTDGCFVPSTPTKLGLWPKYEPKIYLDTSLVTPRTMIQGHDGSQTLAYNDYRDDIILELEKRIFNNIKVVYDSSIFDIFDVIPSYNRTTDYSLVEFNEILAPSFYSWTRLVDRDFSKPLNFDKNNPFTFNYRGHAAPDGRETPGYWRGIYRWILDTDRPNICPWEMLGITIEPAWWQEVYGPAPYTSDNLVMWKDISEGLLREPGKPSVKLDKFVKPFLLSHIPVDSNGNLLSPLTASLSNGIITQSTQGDFVFGDGSPIEGAWLRSSHYPFSIIITSMLLSPAKTFGLLLDRSRIVRNNAGQIIYKDTGIRIQPASIITPNIISSSTRIQTSGIINYLVDYILNSNLKSYDQYIYDLANIKFKLSYRLGGFTSKEKFNLLLDARSPTASGSVFVPQENYNIILNSSSPLKKVVYSGVIITRLSDGFEIKGYTKTQPYFKYYNWIQSGVSINVGGISESFVSWTANQQYYTGKIVKFGNKYYRVLTTHTSTTSFNPSFYQSLPSLPIVGGKDAVLRKMWDRSDITVVPYGTKFRTIQEVVDFLLGYGEYLKDQGFIFDDFNNNLSAVTNWETSAKEFLFWTTQNWSTGVDKWEEWLPNVATPFESIVRYNGDYYRAIKLSPPSSIFLEDNFVKLDGLSTVGSSVISLSPSASKLTFNTNLCVVDDIRNPFNEYEILQVDGTPIAPNFLNSFRDDNAISYSPQGEAGIFGATFYLIQKEQVLIIENSTMFGDTIYNLESGYKQDRIKVAGYITLGWTGAFNAPGFIFDQANISNWEAWKDYALGDIVKYKEFYYSAISFLPGTESFVSSSWVKLETAPTAKLLPNWTYKATQFADFYSLDSDNFDTGQQKMAQHLIGYQKRDYLENIIQDDVSEFKFYQGMIIEKGTQNVLNKLFDVLSAADQESLKFYEEWAIRVGQYGASGAFESIEFIINESLFKNNPQGFELVNTVDTNLIDFIIRQTPTDVYLKPVGYNNAPWPIIKNYKSFLRTAGHVRENEVQFILKSLSDIVNEDITQFNNGDYVWCTFDSTSWNVYKYTNTQIPVTSATYSPSTKQLTIVSSKLLPVETGSYIGISQVSFKGFYKVVSVGTTSMVLSATIPNWVEPFNQQSSIVLSNLVSQKINSIDAIDSAILSKLLPGDLIWAGGAGTDIPWETWKYDKIFTRAEVSSPAAQASLGFGKKIASNYRGNIAAVSTTTGKVLIYVKPGDLTPWRQVQTIDRPFIANFTFSDPNEFITATVLAMSPSGDWLATGSPLAGNASYTTSPDNVRIVSTTGTQTSPSASGAVSLYKKDANNIYSLVATITATASYNFGSSLLFVDDILYIGNNGTNDRVYKLKYADTTLSYVTSLTKIGTDTKFGRTLAASFDNTVLAVSSEVDSKGVVYVYRGSTTYTLTTPREGTAGQQSTNLFGYSVTISNDGSYIAVSDPLDELTNSPLTDKGTVFVYKFTSNQYTLYQELVNYNPESSEYFGTSISFMNDSKTIVVYSAGADSVTGLTTFDDQSTIFDNNSTEFLTKQIDSGRIDVYDRYNTRWVFSESLDNPGLVTDGFGSGFSVSSNIVLAGSPTAFQGSTISGAVYSYTRPVSSYSWTTVHKEISKPDVHKIKRAFLYNKKTSSLLSYLDVIDPMQGKIAGIAEKEIKYKTFYDPATYTVGDSTVTVDEGMSWGKNQVGMLWWDLRTTKFIDSYDSDIVYRNSNWNSLAYGSSVDVYEWVQSTLLPADWDSQADTDAGIPLGISGTTLYGNSAYSIVKRFDTVSKKYKNTYFYWVKNKKITPTVTGRSISAANVANLIANPRGEGYRYLALTGGNSFSLVNVAPLLSDQDVILSVEYWTIDKVDQNIHSQWSIISEDTYQLPATIEQKWFDSLCGKDLSGRVVPDTSLPIKLRYGIENRPRQSMFANRFEALKQLIEQANLFLKTKQISDNRNISALGQYDTEPSIILGRFDTSIDTFEELDFTGKGSFSRASVSPVIVDGKIIDVIINSPGAGYINAPYVTISGLGQGAKIKTVINLKGQVISVDIQSSGYGYGTETVLLLRDFSVLVHQDSTALNGWSIYSYDPDYQIWSRVISQTYDVRKYWNKIDWYSSGYSQFTVLDHSVNTFSELPTISVNIGETVKIRSTNNGTWLLLEKFANVSSVDWTQSYKVVGEENGTIEFKSTLYQFLNSDKGYDGSLYDGSIFDDSASYELRLILNALRDNIFIDDYRPQYINLFFTCVRYALNEQLYLDWVFKTSFVKSKHLLGDLRQTVNYKNDNIQNFEDYISEVTPYRTKIREFISAYSKVDYGKVSVSDFDLLPVYDAETKEVSQISSFTNTEGNIQLSASEVQVYPWKNWTDNVGFTVTSLKLTNSGSGYVTNPTVIITGNSKVAATAKAFIANGKVARIVLLSSGSGYLKSPTITIDGGLSENGIPATAIAIIGNSVVRSSLVKMKFDRITQSYFITQLEQTETFTGTGSRIQFPLVWAPDLRNNVSSAMVDNISVLRNDYSLSTITSTSRGYTVYSGSIVFAEAPASGSVVSVTYLKDWSLLNAADRIQHYYNPVTGQLGKDLSQLMTGIDYGGVIINSVGFETGAGWGNSPYYTDKWDSYDSDFDDYIVTVAAGTHTFTLPYTPANQTIINIYHAKNSVESYVSDGSTILYKFNYLNSNPIVTIQRSVVTTVVNTVGTTVLTLPSTTGIRQGDIVSSSSVPDAIGYGTIVKSIDSSTQITLDQITTRYGTNLTSSTIPIGSTIIFTRTLKRIVDVTVYFNGEIRLKDPAPAGSVVKISGLFTPVRIDDINFGTLQQTNNNAVMSSYTANGVSSVITVPGTFTVTEGDKFIFRKISSDGSVNFNEKDYDTALSGGQLAEYATATGLAPEDIIVDGDELVNANTSTAPEEVVPGQVVDALAIKVFDKKSSASAEIKVDNYITDGTQTAFKISQYPNSTAAFFVKVSDNNNNSSFKESLVDYTIDYRNQLVNFVNPAPANSLVSIFSFGFNGSNLLDIGHFISNGTTTEFITQAPWVSSLTSLVYLDGVPADITLFKTDATYESSNRVGIRFPLNPAANALINYVIVSGSEQTFSIAKTEKIAADGSTTYNLTNTIGNTKLFETSMIVRVNDSILKGPDSTVFTIKNNRLNYALDQNKYPPLSINVNTIFVIADGNILRFAFDYTFDVTGTIIKINRTIYSKYSGKQLVISITQADGYIYLPSPARIQFSQPYTSSDIIEVMSFYNHDILNIQRASITINFSSFLTADTVDYYVYKNLLGGIFILDYPIDNEKYVWVTKNGKLLIPNFDYILLDSTTIKLEISPNSNDEYTLITFNSNVINNTISYMQFKDMINRVHFKRLSLNKQSTLSTDLRYNDLVIKVTNAENFDQPAPALNRPGIVEIRGERIEYFSKSYNFIESTWELGQLRRGTLGTGTPIVHNIGARIQEIGYSQTMPYSETPITEQVISDGTNIVNISFIPAKSTSSWTYDAGYVSSIPAGYGQADEIEVFVGGYATGSAWAYDTLYNVDDIVIVGSYMYRCVTSHTSTLMTINGISKTFFDDSANWKFFIGNIRLQKKPYKVYNVNSAPYSPEGDVQFDAEFSVDGTTAAIRLTNKLPVGTIVTVVKRVGNSWDSETSIINGDDKISTYLRAELGVWYSDTKQT